MTIRPRMGVNVLLALVLVSRCANPPAAPAQPAAPAAEVASPHIILADGFSVRLEIAADQDLRTQGLMYRDRLPPGAGMLFVFPADGEFSFWMKNTLIPLDMIWIDSAKKIVHVSHDVPPCEVDDCPSYAPGAVARYVLELAAGEAKRHGVAAGQSVTIEGIDGIVVE